MFTIFSNGTSNILRSFHFTSKYKNSESDKYAKALRVEFKSLKSTLLEIKNAEAQKKMWNGPALPQLIRLHTTTIESRTVPITKIPMSALDMHTCKSTKFYYMKNTDLPGMDVSNGVTKNGVKVDTVEKCCELCVSDKDCQAFTWITDGHDCWLKKSVNKVTLGKTNLISAITMDSYNLNVKDQVLYEKALDTVQKTTYNGELFWPKIDIIKRYSGNRRKICNTNYNNSKNLVLVTKKTLQKSPYDDDSNIIAIDNHYELLKRAFKRHKRLLCNANDNYGETYFSNEEGKNDTAAIDKIIFDKNIVNDYENNNEDDSNHVQNHVNSESYSIKMTKSSTAIVITAPTIIGFLHGLQRISQFCVSGYCNVTNVNIVDRPQYIHRGLLLDVGRRFIPMATLYMILDGMAALHMNTFHWHLTDWVGIRFETKSFPELNANKRYYKKKDIANIINYAIDRGINVYPELDVPGHAHCFVKASDIINKNENNAEKTFQFCDTRKFELFNDPDGKTVGGIKALVQELHDLFPQSMYIHVGGDETEDKGNCNKKNFGELSEILQQEIFDVHKKTPIVWNEVVNVLKSGRDQTIIQAWSKTVNFTEILSKNHQIIFSQYEKMYLDFTSTSCSMRDVASGKQCLWLNISEDIHDHTKQHLMLGGEVTMWTDEYCPHSKCVGHAESWGSHIDWLFEEKEDLHFSQNFITMIFPRINAAAGSFWKYDEKINMEMFLRRYYNSYYHINNRIKYVAPNAHEKGDSANDSKDNSGTMDKRYASLYNICPINNCNGCTMTHRCGITWKEYFKQFGS